MPRIGRGNPTSSGSPEHTVNATPPRSPGAGAGSAAGRRERHGLLGFLARPFRGAGSPPRASGDPGAGNLQAHEQEPATRAAPRNAAALLQRTPALARGRGEEVMARVEAQARAPAAATGGAPSRSPARGVLTPQQVHRHGPEAQAAAIVRQLRDAGADLSVARGHLFAAMNGQPIGFDRQTMRILDPHFPTIIEVGISAENPLAVALHHALGVPEASGSRSRLTGGAALLGRLAGSGIDRSHLAAAIDNVVLRGIALPTDIRRALQRAGIETELGGHAVPAHHPLLQLRREIHLQIGEDGNTSPREADRAPRMARRAPLGLAPRPRRSAMRDTAQAARASLAMPERADRESNAQYAWRLRNLNPRASVEEIAAAAVGPSGHLNLQATISQLNAMIKTRDNICAAFGDLRTISKADAERLGFRDAATHDEDEATDCLFGEPLSTGNPNQRVIGLAQLPSGSPSYDAHVNKDIMFMDMNKLADHLASQPRPTHPGNRAPLKERNIRLFAFKIE